MNSYKQTWKKKSGSKTIKITILLTFAFLFHQAFLFTSIVRADEDGISGIHENGNEEGQALHKKAVEAAVGGNYVLATNLWIKAYEAYKNPRFSYNLARMAMEMDRPASAMQYFKRFVEEAPKIHEYSELRERALDHIVNLQEKVATLEIICEQHGVNISLNGEYLGTAPLRRTIIADPGKHVLAATLEKHHTKTMVAEPAGGQKHRFEISLEPIKGELVEVKIKEQTRLKYMMPRWVPWSIMGVGLVMGGVSVGLLVRSQMLYDEYDDSFSPGPADSSLERSADKHKNAGIAFAVIGGVTIAAGVVSLALNHILAKEVPVEGKEKTTSFMQNQTILPIVFPGGGGLGAFGRF